MAFYNLNSLLLCFILALETNLCVFTESVVQVCRYCQQEPEKSSCSVCGTSENLWICVICGHVGCGRYFMLILEDVNFTK